MNCIYCLKKKKFDPQNSFARIEFLVSKKRKIWIVCINSTPKGDKSTPSKLYTVRKEMNCSGETESTTRISSLFSDFLYIIMK